jgi:hypothetical protein
MLASLGLLVFAAASGACFVSMSIAIGVAIRLAGKLSRLEARHAKLRADYERATRLEIPSWAARGKPPRSGARGTYPRLVDE